jgi:hypothetical protein
MHMELFDTSVLILDKESNEFQLHGLRARSGRRMAGVVVEPWKTAMAGVEVEPCPVAAITEA